MSRPRTATTRTSPSARSARHGCRVDGTTATIYLGAYEMARPGAPRRSALRSLPEGILDDAGCGGEGRTRKATNGDARTAQFMATWYNLESWNERLEVNGAWEQLVMNFDDRTLALEALRRGVTSCVWVRGADEGKLPDGWLATVEGAGWDRLFFTADELGRERDRHLARKAIRDQSTPWTFWRHDVPALQRIGDKHALRAHLQRQGARGFAAFWCADEASTRRREQLLQFFDEENEENQYWRRELERRAQVRQQSQDEVRDAYGRPVDDDERFELARHHSDRLAARKADTHLSMRPNEWTREFNEVMDWVKCQCRAVAERRARDAPTHPPRVLPQMDPDARRGSADAGGRAAGVALAGDRRHGQTSPTPMSKVPAPSWPPTKLYKIECKKIAGAYGSHVGGGLTALATPGASRIDVSLLRAPQGLRSPSARPTRPPPCGWGRVTRRG